MLIIKDGHSGIFTLIISPCRLSGPGSLRAMSYRFLLISAIFCRLRSLQCIDGNILRLKSYFGRNQSFCGSSRWRKLLSHDCFFTQRVLGCEIMNLFLLKISCRLQFSRQALIIKCRLICSCASSQIQSCRLESSLSQTFWVRRLLLVLGRQILLAGI